MLVYVSSLASCTPAETDRVESDAFVVFGDMEPSPEPDFAGTSLAVDAVRSLVDRGERVDRVLGVGDIAHRGTDVQYQAVAPILERLEPPFHAIPGNEEAGDFDRFLAEARAWNDDPEAIPALHYVIEGRCVDFVFATASVDGREPSDDDVHWIVSRLDESNDRSAVLVMHGAPDDTFESSGRRTIQNASYYENVLPHPALAAVITGDLHLDVGTYPGVAVRHGAVHVHAPGLERTKIGDHVPRMRVFEATCGGRLDLRTFDLETFEFMPERAWSFELPVVDDTD